MDLKTKIGARIQEIRKQRGLTQEKLAEKIDMDTPNLSNIERGKKFMTAQTLEKIALALDVEPKEFFEFGHLKTKEELISQIDELLQEMPLEKIQACYKFINLLNSTKK